jgi:hypothetical protein
VINPDADKLSRRSVVAGAAASLICRPAIVRPASLMPVRQFILAVPVSTEKPWLGFVGMLRLHSMKQALEGGWNERDCQTFGGTSEAAARSYVAHMRAQGL